MFIVKLPQIQDFSSTMFLVQNQIIVFTTEGIEADS